MLADNDRYIPVDEKDLIEKLSNIQSSFEETEMVKGVLNTAHEFKIAGLTPVYFYDTERSGILISTKEMQEGKLH